MATLDDEFARFAAELETLEQQQPATDDKANASTSSVTGKKRPAEDAGDQLAPKKPHGGLAKPISTTTIVAAKPRVYVAPPRPAPVRRAEEDDELVGISAASMNSVVRPGVPNTIADVAAHRGALSGFPVGTTGERAATIGSNGPARAAVMQPRVDMVTGELLSAEEQHMMNMQQSVYEYDPNRRASRATGQHGGPGKHKRNVRMAGGEVWEDQTLDDWPENDFRLFCGDLGNEVSDEILAHAFAKYPSFQRSRVVRDKFTHKSRGYGFVSFADAFDCAKALREMNGKYIGNRPVKISKGKWQERNIDVAKKKIRKKNKLKHHLFS